MVVIGIILLLSQTADAQVFMPNYSFTFTLNENTNMVTAGKTELKGIVEGIPMNKSDLPFDTSSFTYLQVLYPDLASLLDDLLNSGNLSVYPVFFDQGSTNVLETVYLINVNTKNVQTFKKVKVNVENDSMVFGGANLKINVENTIIPYAFSAMMKIDVIEDYNNPFLVLLTDYPLNLSITNSPSYIITSTSILTGEGGGGRLTIENENGEILWDRPDKDWIVLTDEDDFTINFNSPALLLPAADENQVLSFRVTPSRKTSDVTELLNKAASIIPGNEGSSTYDLLNIPADMTSFLSPILQISNGACILLGTNASIKVNNNDDEFVNIGFIRFNYCNFNTKKENNKIEVSAQGEGKLLFLGDTIYNDIPMQQINGFPIPIHPIAVWILSIGVFIIFKIVLKKKKVENKKEKTKGKGFLNRFPLSLSEKNQKLMKWTSLIIYILLLITVFILFDSTTWYLLGLSAFSCTTNNAPLLLCGALLSLQLLCMSLAYLFFGLPIKIAASSILNHIGLDKNGRFIWRGIGLLSMWILGVSYILYVLNVIVLLIKNMIPNMLGGFTG